MKKGRLLIFSAPSGSGKSTIVKEMMRRIPDLNFSVSATNRSPRKNEADGVHYHFLTNEDFQKKIDAGDFLEWEEVYPGRYYGSLRSDVESKRNSGQHVIFDIDVVGGSKLKKAFGDEALAIFIQVPSLKELEKRLLDRGTDTSEDIMTRVKKAEEEMEFAPNFDVIIINDDLKRSLDETEAIVRKFIER
jgi:guanylate kinase